MEAFVHYRNATNSDRAILQEIYRQHRLPELDPTGWCAAQKDLFLKSQFDVQQRHYLQHYPRAQFLIILLRDEEHLLNVEAGRLYIDDSTQQIRIIDISLLSPFRNRGIGTHILLDHIARARQQQKSILLHVERHNRALHLYQRLGFVTTANHDPYLRMEWLPMELDFHTPVTCDAKRCDNSHPITGATLHG